MWKVVIICVVLDNIIMTSESSSKRKDMATRTPGLRLSLKTAMPYKPEMRVVGGQPAPIEKYPYVVQVSLHGVVVCGGTLITQKHVLTAAHCGFQDGILMNPIFFTIRVGSARPLSGGTVYYIAEFIKHPSYNKPVKRDNDIAIFEIDNVVALRNTVALGTIAPLGYEPQDGSTVFYIGWGYLGIDKPQAKTLQEVPVKVVNWYICQGHYEAAGIVLMNPYTLTRNMFCAGLLDVGGKDACGGDSGGPVIEGGVVVGVISWGLLCALPDFPGVNIKVSRYYDWIDRTVTYSGMATYNGERNPRSVMVYSLNNTIIFCVCIAVFLINNKNI